MARPRPTTPAPTSRRSSPRSCTSTHTGVRRQTTSRDWTRTTMPCPANPTPRPTHLSTKPSISTRTTARASSPEVARVKLRVLSHRDPDGKAATIDTLLTVAVVAWACTLLVGLAAWLVSYWRHIRAGAAAPKNESIGHVKTLRNNFLYTLGYPISFAVAPRILTISVWLELAWLLFVSLGAIGLVAMVWVGAARELTKRA